MRKEIDAAIKRVLDSGQYILNKEVAAFEKEFAEYCDVKHAVGVGNGTDALGMALRAVDVGGGDEVITVSHTCSATIAAIKMAGATPVFIDIDPETYLMNPNLIEQAITPRTKAILPVHLYGRMCEMEKIKGIARAYGLRIVEDCCQSAGAGELWGDIGCYSFYPTKNLGGIGDGGAIVTNDPRLDNRVRGLREYGYGKRFVSNFVGINSRLDEIQAAVLRVKLRHVGEEIRRRRALANIYYKELKNARCALPMIGGTYHQFVIWTLRRSDIMDLIPGLQIHYPVPCHLQPAYRDGSRLVKTERAGLGILSLPMRINKKQALEVCKRIKRVVG